MNSDNKALISLFILAAQEPEDVPKFKQLKLQVSKDIIAMIDNFDYEKSLEFSTKVDGKTDEYRDRFLEISQKPVKKTKLNVRFYKAVTNIEKNDTILSFLPIGGKSTVKKIREALLLQN